MQIYLPITLQVQYRNLFDMHILNEWDKQGLLWRSQEDPEQTHIQDTYIRISRYYSDKLNFEYSTSNTRYIIFRFF